MEVAICIMVSGEIKTHLKAVITLLHCAGLHLQLNLQHTNVYMSESVSQACVHVMQGHHMHCDTGNLAVMPDTHPVLWPADIADAIPKPLLQVLFYRTCTGSVGGSF